MEKNRRNIRITRIIIIKIDLRRNLKRFIRRLYEWRISNNQNRIHIESILINSSLFIIIKQKSKLK